MSTRTFFILTVAALLFGTVNTVSAQNDLQSLQTEFESTSTVIAAKPCPCSSEPVPIVIAPNPYRGRCCPQPYPCYRPTTCCPQPYPCYRPATCYSSCYTPAPVVYRRAGLHRPLFFHRYYHRYYSACCY
ncbi:MAG: hypothetical protein LBP87_16080 [Planctomycetaceae bacterium]|nr:hypothetical protein [Planctomycetaceae bacterium]